MSEDGKRTAVPLGDGAHDDTDAIQALLDARGGLVYLPPPPAAYRISRPLRLHARQELRLDPTTEIRLAPHSDCLMLENDPDDGRDHIALTGGIWNFDNLNQSPNPLYQKTVNVDWGGERYTNEYLGVIMRFCGVERLCVRDVTLKNPVTFGLQMACVNQFAIESVTFDYNRGNPYAINMDGVHLDGFCRFGLIRNLRGTCYDDLLALNADDFYTGPIEDIEVDGIWAQGCHSAVRLLSAGSAVCRISISNVFGTYYQYCIGLTRYYEKQRGRFDHIVLRNIFAAKAPRFTWHQKDGSYEYPLIWVESKVDVGRLDIENLRRDEQASPVDTVYIGAQSSVGTLSMSHVTQHSNLPAPLTLLNVDGEIGRLYLTDVDAGGGVESAVGGVVGSIVKL